MGVKMIRLLIILFVILYHWQLSANQNGTPVVKNGAIDLSGWDLSKNPVSLPGEWTFFWLKTRDQISTINPRDYQTLMVPKEWPGNRGYGIYMLHIKGLPIDKNLSLYLTDLTCDFRVSVSKDLTTYMEIGKLGNYSITGKEEVCWKGKLILPMPALEEFYLIIELSNHRQVEGGFWKPARLGTSLQLLQLHQSKQVMGIIAATAMFILFWTNLFLYFHRTEDKASLYLCLFILIYFLRKVRLYL